MKGAKQYLWFLTCVDCGEIGTFKGNNAQEIIEEIDKAGWDHWELRKGLCPKCYKLCSSTDNLCCWINEGATE